MSSLGCFADLRTSEIRGVEALARWRHPTFGLLYPKDFVPLAERPGLIHELAKAEISSKLVRLLTGAAVGIAGGMFIVVAALFVLIGLAYLFWYEFFPRDEVFWGFFVVAGGLVLMGCLSGLIAAKALRRATPPTPNMAIDEARKIREAVAAKDAAA